MTTITASTTVGIDLNPAKYASPVIINPGVSISNPGYPYAVYRHSGATAFFVIQNRGTITSSNGGGVYLGPGGSVTNTATASIIGAPMASKSAVKISGGPANVVNAGSIAGGNGIILRSGGSLTNEVSAHITANADGVNIYGAAGNVVNAGSITSNDSSIASNGIVLGSGGSVTNETSAVITARANGVVIYGGGTVVNAGSIAVGSNGILLASGGSVTNEASAVISAKSSAVFVSGGAGNVVNSGHIIGDDGVLLGSGGSITNETSAHITAEASGVYVTGGAGTVVNAGSIAGNNGIILMFGGSITNKTSALITAGLGIFISGGAGTVVNSGSIVGGVSLSFGGSITNEASALITANGNAVFVTGGAGTVENAGSIAGNNGIALGSGGSVTNETSAVITARIDGVVIYGGAGTVVNAGSIAGNSGIFLGSGGSVTNEASAVINAKSSGIFIFGGGTVANAGSIAGGVFVTGDAGTVVNAGSIAGVAASRIAVGLGCDRSNLMVLKAGSGISGTVFARTNSTNTLELASTSSTGTVAGLGSEFVDFGTITFDAGAQWFAAGLQSGLAGPIYGFAQRDTIELSGDTAAGSSFVSGVLTLDLAGGGTATLDLPGTFISASDFKVTNVATGADVTVACFAAGARILTPAGEVPVEYLRIGDHVATTSGTLVRIIWTGHQRADIPPVRVCSGAFGKHSPRRDLLLSPDHAIFCDGVLVPVRHLINGSTVVQEPVGEVTYYHVELAAHDVILAEGLPCESYLDTGNRAAFAADRQLGAVVFVAPGHSGR